MENSPDRLEILKSALGKPFFELGNQTIYHGDCLEFLSALPAESIDLTVTSPPYNIGKEYENLLPMREYVEWSGHWMQAIHRVTKPHGAFWLNVGYVPIEGKAKACPLTYLLFERLPFFLIQQVIWNYGAGVAGRRFLSPRHETLWWSVKDPDVYTFNLDDIRDPDVKYPNQKKNGKLRCNTIGKNPSDVWQIAKVTSGSKRASPERTPHPAQFPEDLITRVILASSNTNDLVLDPFLGSGTTLSVAHQLGRVGIGFEIHKDYCELAAERLLALDREEELKSRQQALFE